LIDRFNNTNIVDLNIGFSVGCWKIGKNRWVKKNNRKELEMRLQIWETVQQALKKKKDIQRQLEGEVW
jgi:hypothetical protein